MFSMMTKIQTNQFNPIYLKLSEYLMSQMDQHFSDHGQTTDLIYKMLSPAPNLDLGHIAYPCFPLAKTCKKAPPQIAQTLASLAKLPELISEVKATGPYINISLNINALASLLIPNILDESHFKRKLISGDEKWMIEFSQPNTHKELHVGHMRNLCLGNAVTKISRYAGVETHAVTYPGDVGTHVAKCLWYYKKYNKEPVPEGTKAQKGAWLGKLYTLSNNLLEDEKGTDKEDQNRKELTAILHELHDQKGEYFDLWQETRSWSVELMKETYSWADVEFDRWFWESEMDAPSLAYAKELYADGKFIKSEGAIGMDLTDDKLAFCLMIKSDGTGLYATKDVELARKKFEEFGIDRNIYVVDNRQSHHFKQVFKVLEKIGFEKAADCFHLQYAMVELPDGAMSSRKGNIVPLMDLVSQMKTLIEKKYLQKYLDDSESGWTQEEVTKTAEIIAAGAIKYGMVRVDNNRKIVFNMDDWLKLDGETGPYLQYVHARIASIEKKFGTPSGKQEYSLLIKPQESALLLKLIEFNNVVAVSAQKFQTVTLCTYLFELGKVFNSFYAECSIAKAESENLKNARLSLAVATRMVMKQGLALLGITAPQKM